MNGLLCVMYSDGDLSPTGRNYLASYLFDSSTLGNLFVPIILDILLAPW